jgi:MoaE protein
MRGKKRSCRNFRDFKYVFRIVVGHRQYAMEDGVFVSLTHEPLSPTQVMDFVRSPEAGAIVLFAGTTRNNFDGLFIPKFDLL